MKISIFTYSTAKSNSPARQAQTYFAAIAVLALLLSMPAFSYSEMPAVSCESLANLALPDTTITLAQSIAAGEFVMPNYRRPMPTSGADAEAMDERFRKADDTSRLPAFCRVAAILKPSSDSDIKIEVWMPLSGWNGKFQGVGNGGWAGTIAYDGLLPGLEGGYAVASTDTGHDRSLGYGGAFAIGHPEKMIDYGYRAIHEMTVKAKAIIDAFYGIAPKYSLFTGCSLGGQQALTEAKRYPEDYEGIVAGASAGKMAILNAAQLWPAWLISKDPARYIPDAKYSMIHEAALKACATPIGLKHGFIDDPENCRFDPQTLLCKGEDADDCLTAPQVDLMKQIYAGPVNPRTKESIFPGVPIGGELQLPGYTGSEPQQNALELFKSVVYQDPNWDWRALDYDKNIVLAHEKAKPYLYVDPNFNEFFDRGGKLLMYIGWTEYRNPKAVADVYQLVLTNAGEGKAENSIRFFTVPGMDHCSGGAGCDTFDKLGIIDQWVETGKAPDRIIASKLKDDKVIRTRPICAYPAKAEYKGTGSPDDAANFVCVEQELGDNK